jgi:hypothetical protein
MDIKNPKTRTSYQQQHSAGRTEVKNQRLRLIKPMVATVVVIALLGVFFAWNYFTGVQPAGDRYQIVFLDNGQAFFGKLKNTTGTYLRLEQAYQTSAPTLPADATEEEKKAVSSNVSLLKVGDLVYGPENTMMIRAEQVVFWQDLSEDSKVTRAIEQQQ